MLLTLCEWGVWCSAALAEADGRAVVCLSPLGAQRLHGWVSGPSAHEGQSHAGDGRVGQDHLVKRGCVLQQTEVTVHWAHVVLRVHATQRGVMTHTEQITWVNKERQQRFIALTLLIDCDFFAIFSQTDTINTSIMKWSLNL